MKSAEGKVENAAVLFVSQGGRRSSDHRDVRSERQTNVDSFKAT